MSTCMTHWKKIGFRKNLSGDTLIFIKHHDGGDPLIVLVYVDDIALFGTLFNINLFKTEITIHYKVSDLGEITQFLGLHIIRDHSKKTISTGQNYYTQCILQHFDMSNCHPASSIHTISCWNETTGKYR